jgi:hypothetical protein
MELVNVCTYSTLYRSIESDIVEKIILKYETQRMTKEETREWGMHCSKYLVTVSTKQSTQPSIVLVMFTERLPDMWLVFTLMMYNAHAAYNSYDLDSFCKKYNLTFERGNDIYHFCKSQQQLIKSVISETTYMRMLMSIDVLRE